VRLLSNAPTKAVCNARARVQSNAPKLGYAFTTALYYCSLLLLFIAALYCCSLLLLFIAALYYCSLLLLPNAPIKVLSNE